jgi:acetyl-CoA acetyltransferase
VSVFVHLAIDDNPAVARARIAPVAADSASFLGIPVSETTVACGSPSEAAATVTSLWDAGAASVILRPVGDDPLTQFERLVTELGS